MDNPFDSGPVVVVGGAGFIGRALCAVLVARHVPVVVVDRVRASGVRSVDISTPGAGDALRSACAGARAVVHLASEVNPTTSSERARALRLHVDGTRAVVRAARAAGVARFVLVSSATVYGAWPDNPVPLDENARIRPVPSFAYAVDKAEQERIVELEGQGLSVAVARPAIVYGPGARNYLTEILRRSPFLPSIDGNRPHLQFVHVEDVATALAALALEPHQGVFNVASDDWLTFDEVAAIRGLRVASMPSALLGPLVDTLARWMPPHLRAPAAMLPYLTHPFVVSTQKLRTTGWCPQWTSSDALRAL